MNNNALDMFTVLGIKPADSTEKMRNKSEYVQKLATNRAQFLKIVFRESTLLNPKKDNETEKDVITLPYNHDKSINDTLNARITNNWDNSNGGVVGTAIARGAQALSTSSWNTNSESKLLNFL